MNREFSCITEEIEKIEENVHNLVSLEDGFKREITKLKNEKASKSSLTARNQKIEERFKQVEANTNARFEKLQHTIKGISLKNGVGNKPIALSL